MASQLIRESSPVSHDEITPLIDRLATYRLLPQRRLDRLRAATDAKTSAERLLEKLLELNWLTPWQAQALQTATPRLRFADFLLLEPIDNDAGTDAYRARDEVRRMEFRLDFPRADSAWRDSHRALLSDRIEQGRRVEHPFLVPTQELIVDPTTQDWAVASRLLPGGWERLSQVVLAGDEPPATDDSNSAKGVRPSRDQRLKVAAIMRQLAVAWAHAHAHDLYDPGLLPSQVQVDSTGAVRIYHFGLSDMYVAAQGWQQPTAFDAPTDKQQRIRYDLVRLGQLGWYLLSGSPDRPAAGRHSTRLEYVFQWLLDAPRSGRIQSMASAAKAIERWERLNRKRSDFESNSGRSPIADQVMIELNQSATIIAERGSPTSKESDHSFQLGPSVENTHVRQEAPLPQGKSLPNRYLWIGAGITVAIVAGIGLIAVLNLLMHD